MRAMADPKSSIHPKLPKQTIDKSSNSKLKQFRSVAAKTVNEPNHSIDGTQKSQMANG